MKNIIILLLLLTGSTLPGDPVQVQWLHNIDEALKLARKTEKPIFINAFADWCEWCHKLEKEVYSDQRFIQYMDNFVPLRIDIEDDNEGSLFARKYQITELPTLLVMDSTGRITNRIQAFMNATALMSDINKIQQMVEREKKNPADLANTVNLGNEYLAREMNAEAEAHFSRVLASAQANSELKEAATFWLGLSQYYQEKYEPARSTLQSYEERYKNGPSDEDALLLLSEISLQLNSRDQAKHYLEELLKRYPDSGNAARVQQVLSDLVKDENP